MPFRTKMNQQLKVGYSLTPSTLENIDQAVYDFLNDKLNIYADSNKGFQKVPVIFSIPERAYQIKNDPTLRSEPGSTLIYPLISIDRTSINKDPTKRGPFGVYIPPYYDFYNRGGSVDIARMVQQEKTRDRANAAAIKKSFNDKNPNYKTFPGKNKRIVYEILSIPMPTYLDISYALTIKTEYQQQMNQIVAPFASEFSTPAVFDLEYNGNTYQAVVQPEFAQNNNSANLGTDERIFETTISLNVLGFITGADKNQDTPVAVRREGPCEIKIQRERRVLDEEPEYHAGRKTKYRP
jgi:hypothetical protein